MPAERLVSLAHIGLRFYKWHLTFKTLHITDHILGPNYLMASEGYFPVTYSFFALSASRLTFCSLVSVQERHFGKLEHSSLTESSRKKGTFAVIKTNVQNLTAEFNLRIKCQIVAFNTWEPQPAFPWLGHRQSFLMKKSLFEPNSHGLLALRTSR